MKSLPFRNLATLVLLGSLSVLTGCVLTNAESMTLGSTGQVKTRVDAWKGRIQVDEVRGAGHSTFSGKSFHKALQQTLANVGYGAPEGQGRLHLKVQVTEALAANFSGEWGGVLRTHYILSADPNGTVLLSETIGTLCTSHPVHVQPTETSVLEECGRKNIADFLLKLEKKGLESNPAQPQPTQAAASVEIPPRV